MVRSQYLDHGAHRRERHSMVLLGREVNEDLIIFRRDFSDLPDPPAGLVVDVDFVLEPEEGLHDL